MGNTNTDDFNRKHSGRIGWLAFIRKFLLQFLPQHPQEHYIVHDLFIYTYMIYVYTYFGGYTTSEL